MHTDEYTEGGLLSM